MKIADQLLEIERGEGIEESEFSIEGSAKAFEVLSAGLYSDPVMAIVRELSANAADSHVEADVADKPFIVHAPNSLEPYFSIRDFGTGLAPSLVKKLYTRYFKSTKTQSNDLTGCLGLGSKSPFSYVDSFNVTSYWSGKKYIFNAYKNERRLPCIAPLGEEDTDQPNGLEVSFPVKSYDFRQFIDKIQSSLRFFKYRPIVKGIPNFEFEEFDYLIKTNEYGIPSKSSSSLVIMGNIAYPFDVYDFEATSDRLKGKERKLVDWGVHFFVPIGSVEIAASREKLHYSAETRNTVKNIVAQAVEATIEQSRKRLEQANSVWEARLLAGKLRKGAVGEISGFEQNEDILWQGKKVNEIIHLNDYDRKFRPNVEVLSRDASTYRRRRRRHSYYNQTGNQTGTVDFHKFFIETFDVSDYTTIFVNDLNRGGYSAARRYMEENDVTKALMFSSAHDEFIDDVDCRHLLVPVSTLPKPERKKRDPSQKSTFSRTVLQEFNGSDLQNCEVDLDEGGVYVEIRHNKVKMPAEFKSENYGFYPCNHLNYRLNLMRAIGFTDTVYGVRPCDLAKLEKSEGEWITLEQALEDTLRNNSHLIDIAVLRKTHIQLDNRFGFLQGLQSHLPDNKYISQALEIWNKCLEAWKHPKIEEFIKLCEYTNIFNIEHNKDLIRQYDELYEVYPLLKHLNEIKEAVASVCKYIELMDIDREATAEMEDAA